MQDNQQNMEKTEQQLSVLKTHTYIPSTRNTGEVQIIFVKKERERDRNILRMSNSAGAELEAP